MNIEDKIVDKFKILKKRNVGLNNLNLVTLRDLLCHFPTRYIDPGNIFSGELTQGEIISLRGVITKINKRRTMGKKRVMITEANIYTNEKNVPVIWFHQPYIAHQFKTGDTVEIQGKVSGKTKLYITNPKISVPQDMKIEDSQGLTPIYKETKDVSSIWINSTIERILNDENIKKIKDPIPENIRKKLNLPEIYNSFIYIHTPKSKEEHIVAKKRFIFEQIFMLQLVQQIAKNEHSQKLAYNITINKTKTNEFVKNRFEFKPTKSQKKVIDEILKDIEKRVPMARLLEGDVGSGKTAVAATIMYSVITAKKEEKTSGKPQVAYLTPTEVLGRQQFNTLVKLFSYLPINIGFLSSKECLKFPSKVSPTEATNISKAQLKKWIATGEIAIIVGTHSIIQKDVNFKRLALAIIDEQHRFGVAQRKSLIGSIDKHTPHLLSMTATPIPRTLALTIYSDLSLSIIDEVPSERKEVKTKLLKRKDIHIAYKKIEDEVKKGHQAYVLCPRITDTEDSNLRSVEEEFKYLSKEIFPNLNIAILHGKMKTKEKRDVMEKFQNKEIDILVCTTVIEVGLNIKNATTIIILHSEKFGLAQLHQLRGRVIRSSYQPYCFAITDSIGEITTERLKVFTKTHNGFKLAEKDLELRGSGEIAGLKQSGIPDLMFEGLKNIKLVNIAQTEAKNLLKKDPKLENQPLIKDLIKTRNIHTE